MKDIETAFLKLIEENRAILIKISSFYMDTPEDRQDLLSEMVYQLWKAYPSFKHQSKASTWLYRICLNVAVGYHRLQRNKVSIVNCNSFPNYIDGIETEQDDRENIQLLYKFINALKPLDKSLMLLYLDELKYSEIAKILGISETNVGVRINRIKAELKKHFK